MPGLILNASDAIRLTIGGKVAAIDVKPGSKRGQFELAITLVIAGSATRKLDAWRFDTEAEMWAGLAEFAAGKQADLALEAHAREEADERSGRAWR